MPLFAAIRCWRRYLKPRSQMRNGQSILRRCDASGHPSCSPPAAIRAIPFPCTGQSAAWNAQCSRTGWPCSKQPRQSCSHRSRRRSSSARRVASPLASSSRYSIGSARHRTDWPRLPRLPAVVRPERHMRLTAYTDYTLRTLMYLAVNADRHATIAEIARTYRISETHLMKIVHQLGIAGDIETLRGRNGGIRLGRPAESINVGRVVRRTEPDMELVACFGGAENCAIGDACVLQTVLHESLAAFLAVLDRYT